MFNAKIRTTWYSEYWLSIHQKENWVVPKEHVTGLVLKRQRDYNIPQKMVYN